MLGVGWTVNFAHPISWIIILIAKPRGCQECKYC
jgi:uncharacterized membrane protein